MYTLHKLSEGFIVTSYEDIKEDNKITNINNWTDFKRLKSSPMAKSKF